MNKEKSEVDLSFHIRRSYWGSWTLSKLYPDLVCPRTFQGKGCIVYISFTKEPKGPQLVGTKLCITAWAGVWSRGWGGDWVGSLSVGAQKSVPNKLLRLVNFINTDICPEMVTFNILEYTFFSNLFYVILFT